MSASDSGALGRLSMLCFFLSRAVSYWPVALLALAFLSPASLHLRLTAAEAGASCAYAGGRGIIYEFYERPCPLIALIDTRGRGQW